MLENVLDTTEHCRYSLMCRHVCPVGNQTRMETLTPHGWAQLIALERRGLSSWNDETVDALYKCADCGSCRSHCVSSQPLPAAIAAARTQLVDQRLAPDIVYEIADRLRDSENPFERKAPKESSGTGTAALFAGDEVWHLRPAALEAAEKLLHATGIRPVVIGQGRNSGLLASSLGLSSIARNLALATLEELAASGARRLFVLSPGDYFTIGQMYAERLGIEFPANIELVEVIPFLANQLNEGLIRFKTAHTTASYAYVDPTHAVRVPSRHQAPRQLLSTVLGSPVSELFWHADRAYPCGNSALMYTHPHLADSLTRARLEDAVRVGAQVVISEGPGSLAHLERHAPEFGLEVRGLYELLADNLIPLQQRAAA